MQQIVYALRRTQWKGYAIRDRRLLPLKDALNKPPLPPGNAVKLTREALQSWLCQSMKRAYLPTYSEFFLNFPKPNYFNNSL